MDDQSVIQDQQAQDQTNQPIFGQPAGDGALGVNHDDAAAVAPSAQPDPVPDDTPPLGPAKGFFDDDEDDLLSIKQEALRQLNPLIQHLDQTPEEKFRTTMMMIQASDDQTLVKSAYEAAQQIADDKERAKALLDVINEINYFTQSKK